MVHTHTHTHIHNGILLSLEKKWNLDICSNMDAPRGYYVNEISQIEKDKYYTILLICGI